MTSKINRAISTNALDLYNVYKYLCCAGIHTYSLYANISTLTRKVTFAHSKLICINNNQFSKYMLLSIYQHYSGCGTYYCVVVKCKCFIVDTLLSIVTYGRHISRQLCVQQESRNTYIGVLSYKLNSSLFDVLYRLCREFVNL